MLPLVLGALLGARGLEAQDPAPFRAAGPSADPLTVYLVTAAPGDAIWERFGHNGLWIHNEETGEDLFWEWGLFSFRDSGFIGRLARGTMLYRMGGRYLEDVLAVYRAQDRPVWAQELALTPEQERELQGLIWTNALPENAQYVYDYYTDNCSTRARDALDAALGGQLAEQFGGEPAGVTWRWHTRRLLRPDPLAELGLQLVLGNPGDAPISQWEEMFLPMQMRRHLSGAVVGRGVDQRPLVSREIQLLPSNRPPPPAAPAQRWTWALGAGLLLGAAIALLGAWSHRARGPAADLGIRTVGAALVAWSLVAGALGWILVLAWGLTDHDFWRWNENLFQTSPLLLAAAPLALPLLTGRRPGRTLTRVLQWVVVLALTGVVLKAVPGVDQQNWVIVAVATPLNLGFFWAVRALQRERT